MIAAPFFSISLYFQRREWQTLDLRGSDRVRGQSQNPSRSWGRYKKKEKKLGCLRRGPPTEDGSRGKAFEVLISFCFLPPIVTAVTRILYTLPNRDEKFYRDIRERISSNTKVYLITRNTCNIV
jgi:hypothetical protein